MHINILCFFFNKDIIAELILPEKLMETLLENKLFRADLE